MKLPGGKAVAEDVRGKRYSKRALPMATARKQVAAINMSELRRRMMKQG
jgi:hypothetical protein